VISTLLQTVAGFCFSVQQDHKTAVPAAEGKPHAWPGLIS